jgi:hypothetical protein
VKGTNAAGATNAAKGTNAATVTNTAKDTHAAKDTNAMVATNAAISTNPAAGTNLLAQSTNSTNAAAGQTNAGAGARRGGAPDSGPRGGMANLPPGMTPEMMASIPPEILAQMMAGGMPGGPGGGPMKKIELPPEVQARVDRIINSEIFGPVIHPMPMALLGIADQEAFIRATNGQIDSVKVGGEMGGIKLLRIGVNRVLIEQGGEKKELTLFDGIGGASLMPKPSSAPSTNPPSTNAPSTNAPSTNAPMKMALKGDAPATNAPINRSLSSQQKETP